MEVVMSRQIVPGTFWVGISLFVVLLLTGTVWAFRPSDGVPNLVGHWDGFFQDVDSGALGLVRSDITGQVDTRFKDHGKLLEPLGRLITPYELSAMVSDDNSIAGAGNFPMGGVVYQADLETFAGDVGDAGVQHARYQFVPRRGLPKVVNATLLHPFPDAHAPDVSGIGTGTFASNNTTSFGGTLNLFIAPSDHRDAFPGRVMFVSQVPGSLPSFTWDLRATTSGPNHFITPSGANRFVMIAQGGIGNLVADGVIFAIPGGGNTSSFISGSYNLQLIDGQTDFGDIKFTVSRKSATSAPRTAAVRDAPGRSAKGVVRGASQTGRR
jgi:hypothetical protein